MAKSAYHFSSHVHPPDPTPDRVTIGLSLLAFPFVVVVAGIYEAQRFGLAWTRGVIAGLGFGPAADALVIRPPAEGSGGRHEAAYLQYLFGPVWRDVKHTVSVARGHEWKEFEDRRKAVRSKYFPVPSDERADDRSYNRVIGAARLCSLVFGLLLAAALLLLAFVAQAAAIGLLWLVVLGVIQLLRAADSVLLVLRHIRITCPNCGSHVTYPSYRCGGCGKLQHDVRPGRYGMIHRHCRCTKAMPTLLMLGSHRMKAQCPDCAHELEGAAGSMPETVLPVFGPAGAGKTQLLMATALAARTLLERGGGSAAGADRTSEDWLRQTVGLFARGGAVAKTGTAPGIQHANSLRLEVRGRRRVLKMFDAPGEVFQDAERFTEMRYLEANPTFVFVLDPLTVPRLWTDLAESRREKLTGMRAALAPYTVFEATVQGMHRDLKTRTHSSRLAVVVSKADLIRPEVEAAGVGSGDSIREWLEGPLEQGHLVRSIGLEFRTVRYFLTNATVTGGETDPSIETFLSWVLAGDGMPL